MLKTFALRGLSDLFCSVHHQPITDTSRPCFASILRQILRKPDQPQPALPRCSDPRVGREVRGAQPVLRKQIALMHPGVWGVSTPLSTHRYRYTHNHPLIPHTGMRRGHNSQVPEPPVTEVALAIAVHIRMEETFARPVARIGNARPSLDAHEADGQIAIMWIKPASAIVKTVTFARGWAGGNVAIVAPRLSDRSVRKRSRRPRPSVFDEHAYSSRPQALVWREAPALKPMFREST